MSNNIEEKVKIESKNFKYRVMVNKKLSNMNIVFRYLEEI